MRLADENNNYVEFAYKLKGNSYVVDVDVNVSGGQSMIAAGTKELAFDWSYKAKQMEKSKENEANVTSIEYMNTEEEYDYLSPTSDDEEKLGRKTEMVCFQTTVFQLCQFQKMVSVTPL